MKNRLLTVFVLLVVNLALFAQPIKKAQKQMLLYDYSRAAMILKKAVENEKYQAEAIPMLAECYRLQRDPFNAKVWYGRAVKLQGAKPEWYYYYAQALNTVGEYKLARENYLKYAQLNASDKKGAMYASFCDSVLGPWKYHNPLFEIKRVNSINTVQGDFGPAFYEQKLVFSSDRPRTNVEGRKYGWTGRGFLDVYTSSPAAPGEFWGEMNSPALMKGVFNQTYHDGPIVFSKDGNIAYFTRTYHDKARRVDKIKTNLLKIFYTEKKNGKWSELKPFFLNSPDYSVGHPALSSDGQILYFASDMPGGLGGTDIWKCTKSGNGWGKPENLGKTINTPENEMFPFVFDDGTLFFASDGLPGYGGLDIFMSKKQETGWQTPVNLHPPINGSFDDFAIAVAPNSDLKTEWNGFFSSSRSGGVGNDDIYAFKRLEPEPEITPEPSGEPLIANNVNAPAYMQGYVKDKNTLQPIEMATVFILNPQSGRVKILKTDSTGLYKTPVEMPANYLVKAMKPGYISDCLTWLITKIQPGTTLDAPRDLLLDQLLVNKKFKIENIYYDFDKYNIRADAQPQLNKLVRIMVENPINVELGSHTDCRGSFKYNERLAQNRAESAVRYIVSQGINPYRITAKGYGEYQLSNRCADGVPCSETEHQANRRTEFKVTSYIDYKQVSDQFNPDLFSAGDEINAALLPSGFFYECLEPKKEEIPVEKVVSVNQPAMSQQSAPTVKATSVAPAGASVAVPNSLTLFTVQFATNYVDPEILRTIAEVRTFKGNDGVKRFYSGIYSTRAEALSKVAAFVAKGFKDTWVAPIDENRPAK